MIGVDSSTRSAPAKKFSENLLRFLWLTIHGSVPVTLLKFRNSPWFYSLLSSYESSVILLNPILNGLSFGIKLAFICPLYLSCIPWKNIFEKPVESNRRDRVNVNATKFWICFLERYKFSDLFLQFFLLFIKISFQRQVNSLDYSDLFIKRLSSKWFCPVLYLRKRCPGVAPFHWWQLQLCSWFHSWILQKCPNALYYWTEHSSEDSFPSHEVAINLPKQTFEGLFNSSILCFRNLWKHPSPSGRLIEKWHSDLSVSKPDESRTRSSNGTSKDLLKLWFWASGTFKLPSLKLLTHWIWKSRARSAIFQWVGHSVHPSHVFFSSLR